MHLCWALLGTVALWLAVPGVIWLVAKGNAGLVGDAFGSVNALFSALAFVCLLVTLWMQRTELELQRRELQMTRQELKLTREEHTTSNDLMKLQADAMEKQNALLATERILVESRANMEQLRELLDRVTVYEERTSEASMLKGVEAIRRYFEATEALHEHGNDKLRNTVTKYRYYRFDEAALREYLVCFPVVVAQLKDARGKAELGFFVGLLQHIHAVAAAAALRDPERLASYVDEGIQLQVKAALEQAQALSGNSALG